MRPIRLPRTAPAALLDTLLTALVFAGTLWAAVVVNAIPAFAHDAAEGTSPSSGEVLASAPEKVSVTFNRNPLGLGANFSVEDAAGGQWAEGPVQIVDNVASQALRAGAPTGDYTVTWRVVSSDSHPIEGNFSFSVQSGGGESPTAAGSNLPLVTTPASGAVPSAGTVPTLGTVPPGATSASEPVASAAEPFPWSIVVFAVVALGLLVALAVMARRRLRGGEQETE